MTPRQNNTRHNNTRGKYGAGGAQQNHENVPHAYYSKKSTGTTTKTLILTRGLRRKPQ